MSNMLIFLNFYPRPLLTQNYRAYSAAVSAKPHHPWAVTRTPDRRVYYGIQWRG